MFILIVGVTTGELLSSSASHAAASLSAAVKKVQTAPFFPAAITADLRSTLREKRNGNKSINPITLVSIRYLCSSWYWCYRYLNRYAHLVCLKIHPTFFPWPSDVVSEEVMEKIGWNPVRADSVHKPHLDLQCLFYSGLIQRSSTIKMFCCWDPLTTDTLSSGQVLLDSSFIHPHHDSVCSQMQSSFPNRCLSR